MFEFFVIVCIVVFVLVQSAAKKGTTLRGPAAEFDRLVAKGAPARGILLQVSSTGVRVPGGTQLRRFQRRQISLDVEIDGETPYETSTTPLFPTNLVSDILPGATVELRVDRKNRDNIAIVGPGASLPAPRQTPPGSR